MRCMGTNKPKIQEVIALLNMVQDIEYYNALRMNKLVKHNKNWALIVANYDTNYTNQNDFVNEYLSAL